MTEDQMKSEIIYFRKQYEDKCEILAKERDFWKSRYDELLSYISSYISCQKQLEPINITISKEAIPYVFRNFDLECEDNAKTGDSV